MSWLWLGALRRCCLKTTSTYISVVALSLLTFNVVVLSLPAYSIMVLALLKFTLFTNAKALSLPAFNIVALSATALASSTHNTNLQHCSAGSQCRASAAIFSIRIAHQFHLIKIKENPQCFNKLFTVFNNLS